MYFFSISHIESYNLELYNSKRIFESKYCLIILYTMLKIFFFFKELYFKIKNSEILEISYKFYNPKYFLMKLRRYF